MAFRTLKSLKTFYPPDPKSPNYEQEVTNALQKLSAQVNVLSNKVTELDEALTKHEEFYDAPILADQWFLSEQGTSTLPSSDNTDNVRLKWTRLGQPNAQYDTDVGIHGNGTYTSSFTDNFAGSNKNARTRYPHALGMIKIDDVVNGGNGGFTGTDFVFPVRGLYRVILTCVFGYKQKSGQTGDVLGCEPKVTMMFRGGSSLNSGLASRVEPRNLHTVVQCFPQYTNSSNYKYSTKSAEVLVNVTRASDEEAAQNYNADIRYRDTMFFRTREFNTTTYDIQLAHSYQFSETIGVGKTNVIFQRLGPAILNKPT